MDSQPTALRADKLPPYPLGGISEAVNSARLSGRDIIDFNQMNPDLGAPPAAVDRAIQSLLLPHHHRYSSSQGILKLREKFCEYYLNRFGVELSAGTECVATMGIKEGLGHMLLALCNPGDQVVVLTPSYPIHTAGVYLAGANALLLPLFESWEEASANGYRLDSTTGSLFTRLEALFEHTWPRPRAIICSFPHNPTGTTVTPNFFVQLTAFARKHGCSILHDFAHAEIRFDEQAAPSMLAAPGARDHGVEFYSFSKSFQMPGWRIGFAVGNSALISALKRVKSYLDFGIFQPVQLGALAALEKGSASIDEYREQYRSRRDLILTGLREQSWEVAEARAGAFIWARLPGALRKAGSLRLATQLVEEGGVAISPGGGFDPSADEFCRFALGEPENRIREGLRRLGTYAEKMQ